MKIKSLKYFILLLTISLLQGCINEDSYNNDPRGNFEALWEIIDENYCYLDSKKIDWDNIHEKYEKFIINSMSDDDLFYVLSQMLFELKDGHVNLSSAKEVSYYDNWYENYNWNYREDIVSLYYLGKASSDYKTSAGVKYKILDDNIGYIRYSSFVNNVGDGNLDEVLKYLMICDGLIIDVRDNKGGKLTNSTKIAARFTNEKVLVGYIKHKTGKGHNDFSEPYPIYLDPSNGIRWQKKCVVLTNRRCFSATNDFVNKMKQLPHVTIIGDKTGGGGGLPFSSELPNGWNVRFSASPMLNSDGQNIESGIDPDEFCELKESDLLKNKDTMIEFARFFLKK